MLRKQKMFLVMLSITFFIVPAFANAAIITETEDFEVVEFITGEGGEIYPFTVDIVPTGNCVARISDLSNGLLEFYYLSLTITTSEWPTIGFTDTILDPNLDDPILFATSPDVQYFAVVYGQSIGDIDDIDDCCCDSGTGLFGLRIEAAPPVPIPTTLFLLGSGLIGLIGLRRARRNR